MNSGGASSRVHSRRVVERVGEVLVVDIGDPETDLMGSIFLVSFVPAFLCWHI